MKLAAVLVAAVLAFGVSPADETLPEPVVRQLAAEFWPADEVDNAVSVAWCESRFDPNVVAYGVKHGTVGIWQIAADNLVGRLFPADVFDAFGWSDPPPGRFREFIGYATELLKHPWWNAWAAYRIWLHTGWGGRGGWECRPR